MKTLQRFGEHLKTSVDHLTPRKIVAVLALGASSLILIGCGKNPSDTVQVSIVATTAPPSPENTPTTMTVEELRDEYQYVVLGSTCQPEANGAFGVNPDGSYMHLSPWGEAWAQGDSVARLPDMHDPLSLEDAERLFCESAGE